MNILQICANYPPVQGGHGIYARNLSMKLIKYGVNTNILTYKPKSFNESEQNDTLNVQRIRAFNFKSIEYPIYDPTILYYIHKIVKDNDINVINSHTRFFTSTYFASLYRKINKNIIFVHTEHGAGPLIHKNKIVSSICNIYDSTFGKTAIKTADIPIAVGPSSKNFLRKLGCEREIEIIPNSIDCSKYEKFSKRSRNNKENQIIITYIGRLVISKGISDLMMVFSKIELNYNAVLWIVGTGPDERYFKLLAKKLNIDNIKFFGFRNDIGEILSATNIFVNPSFYDSVPTTLLEAGCIGTRVVSTNVGDVPFILGHDYKYIYEVNDLELMEKHIRNIINESDFTDHHLQKRVCKYFDWGINCKKYLKLLEQKVNEKIL